MHCVCLSQKKIIENSSDVSLFSGEESKTRGRSLQNRVTEVVPSPVLLPDVSANKSCLLFSVAYIV